MTREEVIQGLQFTIEMFLFDPSTGETLTEPRNDMDKTTIDACKGAIELLKQESYEDCISRKEVLRHRHLIYDEDGIGYSVVRVDEIIDLPSVTPIKPHGKWMDADDIIKRIEQARDKDKIAEYPYNRCIRIVEEVMGNDSGK